MSAANFGNALAIVLSYEGGLVDNDADPGGVTNLGVTISSLSAFRGKPCTANDIRCLTRATVTPLYKADFWDKVYGDELPVGVDAIVFDCAVNQGPGTAARILQQAAGVTPDGAIGPETIAALSTTPAATIIERVRIARLARYRQSDGWPNFGVGWSRRVNGVAQTATTWATKAAAGIATPLDPMAASKAAVGEA